MPTRWAARGQRSARSIWGRVGVVSAAPAEQPTGTPCTDDRWSCDTRIARIYIPEIDQKRECRHLMTCDSNLEVRYVWNGGPLSTQTRHARSTPCDRG